MYKANSGGKMIKMCTVIIMLMLSISVSQSFGGDVFVSSSGGVPLQSVESVVGLNEMKEDIDAVATKWTPCGGELYLLHGFIPTGYKIKMSHDPNSAKFIVIDPDGREYLHSNLASSKETAEEKYREDLDFERGE